MVYGVALRGIEEPSRTGPKTWIHVWKVMPVRMKNNPDENERSLNGETQKGASEKCTECGIPGKEPDSEKSPAKKILTDSYIEAAYEVLAKEGAIWSGAR